MKLKTQISTTSFSGLFTGYYEISFFYLTFYRYTISEIVNRNPSLSSVSKWLTDQVTWWFFERNETAAYSYRFHLHSFRYPFRVFHIRDLDFQLKCDLQISQKTSQGSCPFLDKSCFLSSTDKSMKYYFEIPRSFCRSNC